MPPLTITNILATLNKAGFSGLPDYSRDMIYFSYTTPNLQEIHNWAAPMRNFELHIKKFMEDIDPSSYVTNWFRLHAVGPDGLVPSYDTVLDDAMCIEEAFGKVYNLLHK